MFRFFRNRRRKRIKAEPFPPDQLSLLQEFVPFYGVLEESRQKRLIDHIKVFLAEKEFVGVGIDITDEIRVVVAAYACILILEKDYDYYPSLETIVIYPTAYKSKVKVDAGGGAVMEQDQVRLGESWQGGAVVLSWNATQHGACNLSDGENVVFHEFAHQLDQHSGSSNGAPILESEAHYVSWARVLGKRYDRLVKLKSQRRKSFLNKYGATNPAEFFAVATEYFFERPRQMKDKMPDLYSELSRFFKQDPAEYKGL